MNEMLALLMSNLASLFDGSMGWAILLLALSVPLALLPLTLGLARKALVNQQRIKALQPETDAIKARLKENPQQMFAAISALYKENGVRVFDRSMLFGALVQWPVFGLLYRTINNASATSGSFLWMRSLALPDTTITAIVLVLTGIAAYFFPSAAADPAMWTVVMQVVVMAFVIWKLSAAMSLYWAASSGVSVVQTLVLRRERNRAQRLAQAGMTG